MHTYCADQFSLSDASQSDLHYSIQNVTSLIAVLVTCTSRVFLLHVHVDRETNIIVCWCDTFGWGEGVSIAFGTGKRSTVTTTLH